MAGPLCPEGGIRLGGDALCAHVCQDPVTHRTVLMSYRLALSRRRQGLRKGVLARLLRLLVPALETQLTFWELDQVSVHVWQMEALLWALCCGGHRGLCGMLDIWIQAASCVQRPAHWLP